MSALPRIAIVGRTNVGKSRLFNRLTESRRAIVTAIPGTTRDANEAFVAWRGRTLTLIDTGGWTLSADASIGRAIRERTEATVQASELILFVLDGRAELTAEDLAFARWLRRIQRPVVLVVNKVEHESAARSVVPDVFRLGFGEPILVSAMNGRGTGDLLDVVVTRLPPGGTAIHVASTGLRLAFVGRPNVGKSSLVNSLLRSDRVLVSPEPFTTRDAVELPFRWGETDFRLVDTAGLRRRARIPRTSIEREGATMTEAALERADVVVFVLDVSDKLTGQDRTIAGQIDEAGKCVVIAANKWDRVEGKAPATIEAYRRGLIGSFTFLRWAPIVFVSALEGQRVTTILEEARTAFTQSGRKLSPSELDELLRAVLRRHPPTRGKGTRYPKIRSLVQTGTRPLRFEVTIGAKEDLHPNYLSFIERMIRERYDFRGCPISLSIRKLKQRG